MVVFFQRLVYKGTKAACIYEQNKLFYRVFDLEKIEDRYDQVLFSIPTHDFSFEVCLEYKKYQNKVDNATIMQTPFNALTTISS